MKKNMLRSSLTEFPEFPEIKRRLSEQMLLNPFNKVIKYTSTPAMTPLIIPDELLGPFHILVKLTLLDCSARTPKCVPRLIAVLSFAWAESNFFSFPAIFIQFCGISIFQWTRHRFIENFSEKLSLIRTLRLETNPDLDNYKKVHALALVLSIPWLVATISWSLFNFFQGTIFYGGAESNIIFTSLMVGSNFYIWFISSISLAYYFLVFSAVNREVVYFNEELDKAKKEKILKNPGVLEKFDIRQFEILNLITVVNHSLSFFGGLVPLFLFYGIINGIYLTSFIENISFIYFAILMFTLAAILAYNLILLIPTCALQEHLNATNKILVNNDELGSSKDQKVYQTYRIMVDRIQKIDTHIHVVGAFPVIKPVLAAAMFFIPNIGFILVMIKKVIVANGGVV
ncbi:Protein CBG08642 [Caenorhabditis briggsae]|uniref:Protein CBG08642 n=1 Tax=Caenorhabditis briggsae TaxID=6238 RepID=A8X6X2_CAEBR|nr:Protein CBG08642 [Caenorhabditis briggsae]CAP28383.2 Protein CBG08642 [Caenorhabditis briggsae]